MTTDDEKLKHRLRRKNHIAKDLRTPKYAPQVVDPKKFEDEEERRMRRFGITYEYDE